MKSSVEEEDREREEENDADGDLILWQHLMLSWRRGTLGDRPWNHRMPARFLLQLQESHGKLIKKRYYFLQVVHLPALHELTVEIVLVLKSLNLEHLDILSYKLYLPSMCHPVVGASTSLGMRGSRDDVDAPGVSFVTAREKSTMWRLMVNHSWV